MKRHEQAIPSVEERQRLFLLAEQNARTVLKRGDRIRVTKCPGTKRWATFECWDGHWIVSRSGINDFAPGCIDMVNGNPVDFTAEPFQFPGKTIAKSLFIPLRRQYFNAFRDGTKSAELRRYGPAWNERTCVVGRPVTISCGYGKQARLQGLLVAFDKVPAENLMSDERADVLAVYGTLDLAIARIQVGELKPASVA